MSLFWRGVNIALRKRHRNDEGGRNMVEKKWKLKRKMVKCGSCYSNVGS
jgi:hypothetical protein